VVEAIHLRSSGATAAAGDGVRLTDVRKSDSAANGPPPAV
jgi:hypothetical protein